MHSFHKADPGCQKKSEHAVTLYENSPEHPAHTPGFAHIYAFFRVLIHVLLIIKVLSTRTSEVGIDNVFVGGNAPFSGINLIKKQLSLDYSADMHLVKINISSAENHLL